MDGTLIFSEAFELWISKYVLREAGSFTDAHYISERTEWDYRQYARALDRFFGGMRLVDVNVDHLHAYQRDRAFNLENRWEHQAGANRIRKEIDMLVRMMREIGTYTEDMKKKRLHRRLQAAENDIPRAMTPEEQSHWLGTAASSERWRMIHSYSIAALQTTMATNEMRSLRIGDVSLTQRAVNVRAAGAKNKYRIRTIPLETDAVLHAFESLIWRAKYECGAGGPQHYLFPAWDKVSQEYDPTVGMSDSGLKKKWQEVRDKAEMPWLRPYDLRHSGITRMAEAGTPIAIIMAFAGHMTLRMQQHYTAISMTAMRRHAKATWEGSMFLPASLPPKIPAAKARPYSLGTAAYFCTLQK